jgi:nitrite reductase/ring-hydroxylating ferredoxin subunit/uncharacterized membrane protein
MKSKIEVLGHPLHPILIAFPFAFLTGTVVFDLLALVTSSESFWTTGGYLAATGIATGLLAAVPGVVDFVAVVPPHSSAKRRATKHMLSNIAALTVFALAWFLRGSSPGVVTVAGEFLGLVLLSVGGWMGGTLVYRNQIGIDHRYANAGQWNEARVEAGDNPRFVPIGSVDDIGVDQMKLLHINERRVVIGRTESGCVAFDDRCSHRGGSLADGVLICGTVQCPWHGSQFDVATGEVKAGPAERAIATYRLRDEEGELRLDLRTEPDRL